MLNLTNRSVLSRRLAAAVVVPGVLTSMLLFAPQATAATTSTTGSTTGICSGVVNQLAHRGTVQENLLKVSAKKNADVIARLQAERGSNTVASWPLRCRDVTMPRRKCALPLFQHDASA